MKNLVKKWGLRLSVCLFFLVGLLISLILNPGFLYAHKAEIGKFTIHYNKELPPHLRMRLIDANKLLRESDGFDEEFKFDLCLNDGSVYPSIIKAWQGDAFAWGFYHQIVLGGEANFKENYSEIRKYRWNLTELIAHEAVHCFEFNMLGFWKSNPVAGYPRWKWEGYPEYIARKKKENTLVENIEKLTQIETQQNENWILFDDLTGTVVPYYKSWILMQYCIDIKKMSFKEILNDNQSQEFLESEMMYWYKIEKSGA